jgi:hypothetical protein
MCVPRQGGAAGEKASDAWIVVSELGGVGVLCSFAKRALRDPNEVVSTVDESGPCAVRGCGIITWGE